MKTKEPSDGAVEGRDQQGTFDNERDFAVTIERSSARHLKSASESQVEARLLERGRTKMWFTRGFLRKADLFYV